MLAVVLMVTLGDQRHRLMLAVVSGASLAGFVLLVGMTRHVDFTLSQLREIAGVAARHQA